MALVFRVLTRRSEWSSQTELRAVITDHYRALDANMNADRYGVVLPLQILDVILFALPTTLAAPCQLSTRLTRSLLEVVARITAAMPSPARKAATDSPAPTSRSSNGQAVPLVCVLVLFAIFVQSSS